MRNLTLILCLIALVGAIISGGLFFLIGNSKQALHTRWQNAEAELEAVRMRTDSILAEKATLENRVRVLDTDLASRKREVTALQLEFETLRQTLELAEEARNLAIADRDKAQAEVVDARSELTSMEEQLRRSASPAEIARFRQVIADLESRIAAQERRLAQKSGAPALLSGRENHAQVIKVGPRNAFVVINFGNSHGAAPNQRLLIKRGSTALATVEISLSREHYSIAQVLPETLSGSIRKGDAASLTL